jgi:hypothetical protein
MTRPNFLRYTQAALAALMTLTVGACGKGLFTGNPVVNGADSGTGGESGTGADGAAGADLLGIDTPVPPASDASFDQRRTPDAAGEVPSPGSSKTETIDLIEGSVTLGVVTFDVPRKAFAWPTDVTLTLISEDGKLEDHPGAVGPVVSLSKTPHTDAGLATLELTATLTYAFTPSDLSISAQRLTLAYLSTQSVPNLWIPIASPLPKPVPGTIVGSVSEFSGAVWFAPVVSCANGQACPAPETCQSNVCQ